MSGPRKCKGGPGAHALGGCGHLLVDFHDHEGCHAPAATKRNARYYLPSGYMRDGAKVTEDMVILRCPCRVTRP